jgi:hypothetical protein
MERRALALGAVGVLAALLAAPTSTSDSRRSSLRPAAARAGRSPPSTRIAAVLDDMVREHDRSAGVRQPLPRTVPRASLARAHWSGSRRQLQRPLSGSLRPAEPLGKAAREHVDVREQAVECARRRRRTGAAARARLPGPCRRGRPRRRRVRRRARLPRRPGAATTCLAKRRARLTPPPPPRVPALRPPLQ